MAEDNGKERIQKFDIARTLAILCVLICHSGDIAYPNTIYVQLSNISQIFRIVLLTVGRLGVPIFLFLTGALILKKQIEKDEDVNQFYKRNLLPLLITIEIWNVIYNIFLVFINKQFNIGIFLKDILFLKQVNMPNMWYMPMILGMYIAIPFIARIVKIFTLKTIKIPMLIVFIVLILLPSANILLNILKMEEYKVILDVGFLGGVYGLYILLGYYINNGLLKKYNNIFLQILAGISFIVTVVFQYITGEIGEIYYVWYDFVTLFICSICIFELLTRVKDKDSKNILIKLTKYVSKISLGIFFVHEIFLNIFVKYTEKLNINNPIESLILFILSTVCSIIFIYVTSKIKLIKERVFLIKN